MMEPRLYSWIGCGSVFRAALPTDWVRRATLLRFSLHIRGRDRRRRAFFSHSSSSSPPPSSRHPEGGGGRGLFKHKRVGFGEGYRGGNEGDESLAIARRRTLVPLAGSLPPPAHHIPLSKREVGSRWKRGEKRKIEEPLFLPIFHRRPSFSPSILPALLSLCHLGFFPPLCSPSPEQKILLKYAPPLDLTHSLSLSRPCCSCSLFSSCRAFTFSSRRRVPPPLRMSGRNPLTP